MKIHNVAQGSAEWRQLRVIKRTASEASAMMGASPKIKRSELLHMKATGTEREFSDWVQKNLLDKGHEIEAKARLIAENMIGEELYPVTGESDEDSRLLASLDGATMLGDVIWECKSWNEAKAAAVVAGEIPDEDYWQVVHQLLVSGAERCLYSVTDGTEERTVNTWTTLNQADAIRLVAGWDQFDKDLATYKVEAPAIEATGKAPEALPALRIEVTGMVTATNMDAFKKVAQAAVGSVNTNLQCDQDFADAEKAIKWCEDVETKLAAAKQHALSQTESIDLLFKTMDETSEEFRQLRLKLEKLVKSQKQALRDGIVMKANADFAEHTKTLEAGFGGKIRMPAVAIDVAGAIKGKKSLDSLRNAADTELARAKVEATLVASGISLNLASLRELANGYEMLFSDAQQLVSKANEDLVALIKVRISEHTAEETKRLEADRQRIREQERADLERQQLAAQQTAQVAEPAPATAEAVSQPVPAGVAAPAAIAAPAVHQLADNGQRIKLGDISTRLGFTLTADFLRSLGFEPVDRERAAMLYRASDFPRICAALITHIQSVQLSQVAA